MKNNNFIVSSVLNYSKSQRIGIVLLFLIIIFLQGFYFFYDFKSDEKIDEEQGKWLANQQIIDTIERDAKGRKPTIYPFNPNFLTDFKAYKLGMSVSEIDRLLAFRKQNKFVNSPEEFQQVTGVSDSLLGTIAPFFKFPDWVKNKKTNFVAFEKKNAVSSKNVKMLDLNQATKEDLMKVYGVGEKLSDRILTEKEKYGAFVSMEQLQDVWGLSPEVIENLNKSFVVKSTSNSKKVNINKATIKELSQFPFFRYALAKEIVIYRSMNGDIKMEDLSKIKGFPIDKISIIALYLDF